MTRENSLIYGVHAVKEAIDAGQAIDKILIDHHLKSKLGKELKELTKNKSISISFVPTQSLDRLCRKAHQGIIAFISPVVFADLQETIRKADEQGEKLRLLMLDHITDVRNFGAIARSAECFGFSALIVPEKGSAALNEDAVKTSAGALLKLAVCKVNNLHHSLTLLQENGIEVIAISEHADKTLDERSYDGPIALILGSEEKGVHPVMLKHADDCRKINMKGSLQSLNVSAAGAIAMYVAAKD